MRLLCPVVCALPPEVAIPECLPGLGTIDDALDVVHADAGS